MPAVARTILLPAMSNVFMTFAWYAHLKKMNHQKWYLAAMASWGLAFFEYLLQAQANRTGYTRLDLPERRNQRWMEQRYF